MHEIKDALHCYTVNGLMGQLLDAEEDTLPFVSFLTFEVEPSVTQLSFVTLRDRCSRCPRQPALR